MAGLPPLEDANRKRRGGPPDPNSTLLSEAPHKMMQRAEQSRKKAEYCGKLELRRQELEVEKMST